MKKNLLLIVTLVTMTFATVAITSCKKKAAGPSLQDLQNQLNNLLTNSTTAEQARTEYSTTNYDIKGSVKQIVLDDPDGISNFTKTTYNFNTAQYLTSQVDERYNSGTTTTYKSREINVDYDNNNYITQSTTQSYNTDGTTILYGHKYNYTIANGENTVEEYSTWTNDEWVPVSKYAYTYLPGFKGKIATDTSYYYTNGQYTISSTMVYTYDKSGNLLSSTTYEGTPPAGTKSGIAASIAAPKSTVSAKSGDIQDKYTYEYDAKGNWVTMTYGVDEVKKGTVKRTITYY